MTLLFTDIEGSTRLARSLGDRFEAVLEAHNRILRDSFSAHGGTRSNEAGDGFFVVFARARDAVAAAVEAQRALAAESWPENAAVKVRMGIHTGEVNLADTHRGVAVHRVARISAAAHGGQIVLSQSTQTTVEDVEVLVPDLSFEDLGDHLIKDFDRPVRLYQLVAPGLDERFPPLSGVEQSGRARTPADDLSIRLLGSLEVSRGGSPLEIGGQKQRAVIAILALNAGRVVSTDRLVDLLWGEQPPKTAVTSLQNFISQLRKTDRRGRRRHKGARLSPEHRRRASRPQPVRAARCRGPVARARGARQAAPGGARRSGEDRRLPTSHSSRLPRPRSPASRSFARLPSKNGSRPTSRPARLPSSSESSRGSSSRIRSASGSAAS